MSMIFINVLQIQKVQGSYTHTIRYGFCEKYPKSEGFIFNFMKLLIGRDDVEEGSMNDEALTIVAVKQNIYFHQKLAPTIDPSL